jgi:predicted transport protein
MPIFITNNGKLKKLGVLPLDKEKNLQQLLEVNLVEVLELFFLASEYVTTFGGRIDTLAVDTDGAPVIIEYKRNKNDNVINQALSYLKWLKTQKPGFFEKIMIDKLDKGIVEKIKLDWQNPRVICIAESYSKFDIDTVEVVPLRIELFRYRYYEEGIFALEPVNIPTDERKENSAIAGEKPEKILPNDATAPPSIEGLLAKGSPTTRALFADLRERILALDEGVKEKVNFTYVAYRDSKNFAEIYMGKGQIKIHLRPIDYDDPKHLVAKVPDSYNWTMDRRAYLNSSDEMDYVMGLVEQSYKNIL